MFFYYMDLGWRSIKKTPYLSLLMVLAISIGIGITITTFNVYQQMNTNPAGERSTQLFAVQLMSQGKDTWPDINAQITYQDAMNLRQSTIPTRQIAMYKTGAAVQTGDANFQPMLENIRATDSDFFDLFSVPFIYGAPWDKSIDVDAAYQVVIDADLNQRLFKGENSVGRELYLNQMPYQVVGVIADWHQSPKYYDLNNGPFSDPESIYVPLSLAPIEEFESWGNNQSWNTENIRNYQEGLHSETHWLQYWVELESEQQVQDYQAWLQAYVKQQQGLGRFERDDARGEVSDVQAWLDFNKVVPEDNKILVGLSVLFLVVCLVNMLGLLLAKFLKRAPEVGVRRAIGASRLQIFAQYMIEVAMIGAAGGVFGLLWAWMALSLLTSRFKLGEALTQLDLSMWIFAPMIAIVSTLLAGMYPAWRICRTQPSIYLKSQ
ncbi:ABC transporter permease [Shewanella surugensis]|uniref:ABC transporter permease n=1 Tax=Shewanella surugensis TaxID=212020 RepID=A0ABT0L6F8_9GAMM|nr:ABC transporter permease [Shewanella surugensis]MCL1123269.1 ABC transporter permease [Shewanella surugensis]